MMRSMQRVTVEGLNADRFIRRAGEAGITLQQMKRSGRQLSAVSDIRSIGLLTELAESGGWELTAGEPVGIARIRRRAARLWPLWVMILMMLLLCGWGSRMMWQIDLQGAGAYEADVLATLREAGLRTPMPRSRVNPSQLRDALEWRYPEVAWVECAWRGVTLEIRFVQGIHADPEATECGPCDIVAERDGIVMRIITRAGTPVVAPGDTVCRGDVLIRGAERSAAGQEQAVAARGSVYARVWDMAAVKTPLQEVQSVETGRIAERAAVECPWFRLWQMEPTGFTHEDVHRRALPLGGFFWPLTMMYETAYETDYRSGVTDYRSVIDKNNQAALQKLTDFTGGKESLVDNWVNWSIIEDEILLSVATGERVVDIARQERSSGMAAPE